MSTLSEYPYRVDFPRTPGWWDGDWRDIATWCDQAFGAGEWNYFGDAFVFSKESQMMLFLLKWRDKR